MAALRGVVCLFSGVDGALLALLDSATVTAWRTGLAAALGTHLPASPGPSSGATVGVIGAGAQADLMVRGLRTLRPCGPLLVHDPHPERAAAFAARHDGHVVTSPQAVAAEAGIVLLATSSRTPLLHLADTRPGRHLTTLGADEPGKRELAADLLDAALLVVDDDHELAAATGTLATPGHAATADLYATAGLPTTAVPTLTDLLTGAHPGRTSPDTRTVYAPVGLPLAGPGPLLARPRTGPGAGGGPGLRLSGVTSGCGGTPEVCGPGRSASRHDDRRQETDEQHGAARSASRGSRAASRHRSRRRRRGEQHRLGHGHRLAAQRTGARTGNEEAAAGERAAAPGCVHRPGRRTLGSGRGDAGPGGGAYAGPPPSGGRSRRVPDPARHAVRAPGVADRLPAEPFRDGSRTKGQVTRRAPH
ncbi:ornithine cyclodeaminase/mu-crystallin [Streptomyces albidoflavus]|nr:ornithine cyclodeaminase/mu-crystallin [Streptomyces albidoflavus]